MVIMEQIEFYKYYIPALIKALECENNWEQFNIKSPDFYLNVSEEKQREIEIYLDKIAGQDAFLDNVAYYFDAKSHGYNNINGIKIDAFRKKLIDEILNYKRKFAIK